MFASSAFVLAALTMTGIYMNSRNEESQDNGYTIDFTELEESADDKYREIAQNTETQQESAPQVLEDDLDYMPMEAGSAQVEIPGLTSEKADALKDQLEQETRAAQAEEIPDIMENAAPENALADNDAAPDGNGQDAETPAGELPEAEQQEVSSSGVVTVRALHFSEEDGLIKPVNGETLIPYSMNGMTYFTTLDLYKYNPAVMISAPEGTTVSACAEGKVVNIYEDAEIGHAVTMELGDGYMLTYGQLKDINVSLNSYVNAGEAIGSVAAPTKYFCLEGSNLYLKLTRDGNPVDPERLF